MSETGHHQKATRMGRKSGRTLAGPMLATFQELFPSNAQELLEKGGISRVGLPYAQQDIANDRDEPICIG